MANFDFKAATPETSITGSNFVFGAGSQSDATPAIYEASAFPMLGSNNVFTRGQTITEGTANESVLASTGYSITGSNATSMIDLAGTWNTTGAPTAALVNVLDTASDASSLLLDLQIGGVSQFSVSKAGIITSANGTLLSNMTDTWNNGGTQFTSIKMDVTNTASASGSKVIDLQVGGASLFYVDPTTSVPTIFCGGHIATSYGGLGAFLAPSAQFFLLATGETLSGASSYIRAGNSSNIDFGLNNTARWRMEASTYNFLAVTDNVYDIGASGANRPKTLYLSDNIVTGATDFMHETSAALADGAAANTGTLTNAPASGNPTKWIAINDNGTTRYIPAW